MILETVIGADMLQNELLLLKIIVGVGFLGWMGLMFVQVVLMDNMTQEVSNIVPMKSNEETEYHHELKKAA